MNAAPLLTAIITTRNEAGHIARCVAAFQPAVQAGWCEVLVVDNASTDGTAGLAAEAGASVLQQGPERSTQRNRGVREARSAYVFIVDADMIVPPETLAEIRERISGPNPPDGLYVREIRMGRGLWLRARNFERSFYDGTCIDALRVFRRDLFLEAGGYDESLAGPEDWDFDRQYLAKTSRVAITGQALLHNETAFNFKRHLQKKAYYAGSFDRYIAKWGKDDPVIRRQFGFAYRFFTVFFENGKWRRALKRPDLLCLIWLERILTGLVFVCRKKRPPPNTAV